MTWTKRKIQSYESAKWDRIIRINGAVDIVDLRVEY